MNIFVTGGAGYIGSATAEALLRPDILSRYSTRS